MSWDAEGRGSLKAFGVAVTSVACFVGGARIATSSPEVAGAVPLAFVESVASLQLLAALWFLAAAFGVASLTFRRLRPATFALAIALHVLWGFSHMGLWLIDGAARGWRTGSTYLVLAAFIVVVAGVREGEGWIAQLRSR